MQEAISGYNYLLEKIESHYKLFDDRASTLEKHTEDFHDFVGEMKTHFKWIKGLGGSSLVLLIIQTVLMKWSI